jgi:hypothetical protein
MDMTEKSHEQLALLTYIASVNSPLQDPRTYLEMIPWVELEPISSIELEQAGIPTLLPNRTGDVHMKWVLWTPASRHFFNCHHLYTEDEVYQYCIEKNWHFPGHFLGDRVVFAASPLEDTQFVHDLQSFWSHWVCLINSKLMPVLNSSPLVE